MNCLHTELISKPVPIQGDYIGGEYYQCKACGAIAVFHLIKWMDKDEHEMLGKMIKESTK